MGIKFAIVGLLFFSISVFGKTHDFIGLKFSKNKKEIVCLAKVIYGESRGEPKKGKIAVGFVILNRIKSKKYPNTICKVVYQRKKNVCQFTSMCLKNRSYDSKTLKLAKEILLGKYKDPTNGALYFHNDSIQPYWSSRYEKTTKIGRHTFYR